MSQITNGIRRILSHPVVYSFFQNVMGARKFRDRFASRFIRPSPDMNLLDIGCGPADILHCLPDLKYWGYDISAAYVAKARADFGQRGQFFCKALELDDLEHLPQFDVVLAIGLLHHLDDDEARQLILLAHQSLRAGGRLLTVDPCVDPLQNKISRFLVTNDRGQNVREKSGYENLVHEIFDEVIVEVNHQKWIPYTHCIMECRK